MNITCLSLSLSTYRSRGVEVLLRNRETITKDDIESTDILISAGGRTKNGASFKILTSSIGDGNFLTGASLVLRPDKLVVGVNTDPER